MTNFYHVSETDLSDFFKDANGFRPSGIYKEWWTEEEIKAEYNHLGGVMDDNNKAEAIANSEALVDFNKLVDETIELGAPDKETAIKWLVDGEDLGWNAYDLKYFFWGHGLSYELQNSWTSELCKGEA